MSTGRDPALDGDSLAFLQGGGEMGELIRSRDWQNSELGPPAQWPVALKTSISTVLNSGTAMLFAWGDNLLQFYNDGYIPILTGGKHPAALGLSVRESFPEIWDEFLRPLLDGVLTSGKPIAMENARMILNRGGDLQESFFTFSYSPIRSLAGKVCGVISVAWETTEDVIIKRRERGLRLLTEQLMAATTPEELRHAVGSHVEDNRVDLPFLLWYERDELLKTFDLVMSCGISAEAPLVGELGAHDRRSVLCQAIDPDAPVARLMSLPEPATDWLLGQPPGMEVGSVAIEPLCYVDYSTPDAYLVFGVGAQRPFDGAYKNFLGSTCHAVEQAVRRISAVDLERRDSLRQFDAVTAVVPSLVWMSNADGARTFVSKRWLDFTGRTDSDSLGHGWMTGIHADDQADVADARRVAFANRRPLNMQYRFLRADGQYRWMLDQGVPRHDERGNFLGMVGSSLDITERRQAQMEAQEANLALEQTVLDLEQERQRLLDAQRVANVGSWETELATGRLTWSDETHRIHETQPAYFQPTYPLFLQLVHPDDRERLDRALADSIQGGDVGVIEHRLLLPDGRIKHVEERWQIELDAEGVPVRAIGTCQDVTVRRQAESDLRNTSDRLHLATQSARIGIWDFDVVANTLLWDAQMLQQYGLDADDFGATYATWTQRLHPDDRERVQAEMAEAIAGTREYHTQFRIIRPDGQQRDIDAHGIVQRAADGTALRMIGANRDITEQMQADRRIHHLNRMHAMTSSVNALIVRARDRDELFQQACRIAVELGGFRVAMIGVVSPGGLNYVAFDGNSNDAVSDVRLVMATRGAVPSPMAARAMRDRVACVSNASQLDPEVVHQDMHVRYGILSMAILPLLVDGAPVGVMALYATEADFFHAEEIALLTELAGDVALAVDHLDKRDRLEFLAYYDALTGLANRRLFLERVGQYVRSAASAGGQLAVLIFDLERFKNINDSLGRDAGDDLLKQVAAWLTRHFGDANLLARMDADHFGLVLPVEGDSGEFARVIENVMTSFLGHSFDVNGETLRIAARAGIAMHPADGEAAEALFERAEAALKKANASGARYLFYAQKMTDAVAGRLELESQLRNALENQEFVLHYQPKINLDRGLLSGAEALIRWNNPRSGLMPPALFIPILEETGMINEVGRWALQQAVSDWLRWHQSGLPAVPIAVNVSPLQLRDPAFISQLKRVISVAQDAEQALQLEITESMIMDDMNQSIATLKAIREMGISVAIDDFGTGFSSLGYLGRLPIDTLKIDRMFIVDMEASAEGLSMVSTMLMLAHSLKLKVVAEGVETAEQARLLGSLKCDEIQGYLVSPPLACADFEARFLATPWRMP